MLRRLFLWLCPGSFLLGLALSSKAQVIPFAFWRSQNIFTWIGGPKIQTTSGLFGTQGTAAASNIPGQRQLSVGWTDSSGNFWIYGGFGYDGGGNLGPLSDLWKFTPGSGQWTWMNGSAAMGIGGNWGTQGTGSTSNNPGPREEAAGWTDSAGNLWLFGGDGFDSVGTYGFLNDLWEYTPSSGKWTWVSGASTAGQNGAYGTKGTGSTSNHPGGRAVSASWIDSSGNFWIFGGYGLPNTGTSAGYLDDLWEYTPSSSKWTWISGVKTIGASGTYGTKGTGATANTPGARGNLQGWYDGTNLWLFGGFGYDVNGTQNDLNDVWEFTPSSKKWTWIAGANTISATGSYGTMGTGSTSNIPGARSNFVSFADSSGNFWLFGGLGYDSVGSTGDMSDLWEFNSSTLNWTWVSGPSFVNQLATYGTQGTGSVSNIPGSRAKYAGAMDSSGNFWLLGGFSLDSRGNATVLSDLWEYTLSNNKWDWISGYSSNLQFDMSGTQGTSAATNWPSGRTNSHSWVDSSGNFWLFGGFGIDSGDFVANLGDLWEFKPTTGQWTWVSGSLAENSQGTYGTLGTGSTGNIPGSRSLGGFATDSAGNFWLFGGNGYDGAGSYGALNDLWKYNPTNGQWTWVSGSNSQGQGGAYGTLGTGSTSNIPGARNTMGMWSDTSGNLWIFGGQGLDSTGSLGNLNDLWKYTVSSGQWTWISGSNLAGQNGTYGTKGTGSTSNTPGCRQVGATWIDKSGNLWFFGGYGNDSVGSANINNDLWEYTPSSGKWTWISGVNTNPQLGNYGTLGVANSSNVPGSRQNAASWIDGSGTLWLLGGYGYDSIGTYGNLNDLWKFSPSTGLWTWTAGSTTANAIGSYGLLGDSSLSNIPGGRNSPNIWVDKGNAAWIFGGAAYDSTGAYGYFNDLWRYSP